VKEFILEMKNNKATGYKGIPAEFRKIFCIRRDGIKTLTNMFNKLKKKEEGGEEFPMDWKTAVICQTHKGKGNREKPGNYNGISPLSVCGRIFSGILAGRLRDWIIYNKALWVFQAGFMKGKRNRDNVFVIETTADKYLRPKRGRSCWCSLKFEKAFGSIHREILWYKLRKGVSDDTVKCVNEMYEGIKSCVEKTR
jgi:hypothetical protein